MEVRVQGKKEAPLTGMDPVLAEIHKRLQSHPQEWLRILQSNPAGFADLEKKVHHAFQQMADPNLPDDTRLWAALQQASGGTWAGCVYDTEAILQRLEMPR